MNRTRNSKPKGQPLRRAASRRAAPPPRPSWLRRRLGLILGLALLAVFVHDVFGERGFLAMRRSQREAEKLQQEIRQLNEENRRLAERVQALKTDPRLIERIAREQMGLARPGELVFKLPPKVESATGKQ